MVSLWIGLTKFPHKTYEIRTVILEACMTNVVDTKDVFRSYSELRILDIVQSQAPAE